MRRSRLLLPSAASALLLVPLLGVTASTAHDRGDHRDDRQNSRHDRDRHRGHDRGDDVDIDDLKVLASGLDNPRGLAVARDGDVYVALSGRGNEDATAGMTEEQTLAENLPCFTGPEGLTCLGDTGAIVKIDDRRHHRGDPAKAVRTVVADLPSLASPGGHNAIGVTDVSFDRRGRLFTTIGLGGDPALRENELAPDALPDELAPLVEQLATLNRVNVHRGTLHEVANLADFEATENPHPDAADTNPYSLVSGRHGHVVADAGGNTLLHVSKRGHVTAEFVFPNEDVTVPPAAGGDGTAQLPAQAVPNAAVKGPDGAYYIGQLTGFPFAEGAATVWRWVPGSAPEVYADGFTHIIDLAFTEDGDLLVLQIARSSLLAAFAGDWTGALFHVPADDPTQKHELFVDGAGDPLTDATGGPLLFAPAGLAVDDDTVYLSNKGILPGGGEILRFEIDD